MSCHRRRRARTPLVLPAARAVRGGGRNAGRHAGPAPSVEPAFDYTSCACGCGLLHSLGVCDVICGAFMQIRVICVSFVPQDGGRVHVQSEYNYWDNCCGYGFLHLLFAPASPNAAKCVTAFWQCHLHQCRHKQGRFRQYHRPVSKGQSHHFHPEHCTSSEVPLWF